MCIVGDEGVECTCLTGWNGKVCSGICGGHSNCSNCLLSNHDVVCGWCDNTKTCVDTSFASTCISGYSTSYCG